MSSAPRSCAEARVKVRAAEHDDEWAAGAQGVDQIGLVGLVEGRDVDHPHLADMPRRTLTGQEHLVDSYELSRPVGRKVPTCRPWHSIERGVRPHLALEAGPWLSQEGKLFRRRFPSEHYIAMRVPAESINDRLVLKLKVVIVLRGVLPKEALRHLVNEP